MADDTWEARTVRTGAFLANFVSVLKPRSFVDGAPEKYEITMLFSKEDKAGSIKAMRKACNVAMAGEFKDDPAKWPKGYDKPWKDGDDTKYAGRAGYAGKVVVKASCSGPPGVVDKNNNDIFDEKDFYSGCIARAVIVACAYGGSSSPKNPRKGVKFFLQAVQKVKDGPRLSSRVPANKAFVDHDMDISDIDSLLDGLEAEVENQPPVLDYEEPEDFEPEVRVKTKVAPAKAKKAEPAGDDSDMFS